MPGGGAKGLEYLGWPAGGTNPGLPKEPPGGGGIILFGCKRGACPPGPRESFPSLDYWLFYC